MSYAFGLQMRQRNVTFSHNILDTYMSQNYRLTLKLLKDAKDQRMPIDDVSISEVSMLKDLIWNNRELRNRWHYKLLVFFDLLKPALAEVDAEIVALEAGL